MTKPKQATEKEVELVLIDEPDGIIRMQIDPDAIDELSESIRAIGQLQAILLRPIGQRYEIVYGHRRYLAIKRLGWTKIRASIRELDDGQVAIMRATENIQREDISPIEEAAVYHDLVTRVGMTRAQIAEQMGKSEAIVKRRLSLLNMPPCLQKAIHSKEIGYAVAEELWRLRELPDIEYFLMFAVEHGATLQVVRGWVKEKLDQRRRAEAGDVPRGELSSPMEPRPVFVACDVCLGPMQIGEETVIRACKQCTAAIASAMKGGDQ